MVLDFTLIGGLTAGAGRQGVRHLLIAALGCNVAWGIIDAALFLLGSVFSRNQRVQLARRLKAAKSEQQAMAIMREEFDLEDEPAMSEEDRAPIHRMVLQIMRRAATRRAHLRRQDFEAAAVVILLVSLTAVPGVAPFLFLQDGYLALRTANAIQVVLLFVVGYSWAEHTGANPWCTGLAIVALGIGMVLVAVVLGG